MSSTISCPSCQRTLRVPESLLGHDVKCPSCAHNFTAPDGAEGAPSPVSDRPSRRPAPPPEDDYDEPRPSKRRPRDDYDDDYDDRPRRRDEKPGKVQGIGIMILIAGIISLLYGLSYLGVGVASCVLLAWPGTYYAIVLGIMAIIKGSQLLGDQAHRQPPPSGIAVMMIINIINCDFWSMTLGILVLVFLNDEEVKGYFR